MTNKPSYILKINDDNLGSVLQAGKEKSADSVDFSVITDLRAKETDLKKLEGEQSKHALPKLGSSAEIVVLKHKLAKAEEDLNAQRHEVELSKKAWVNAAQPLFAKACDANLRITVGPNGFSIEPGDYPGLYTSATKIKAAIKTNGITDDVAANIIDQAKKVAPMWAQYLGENNKAWQMLKDVLTNKTIPSKTSIETLLVQEKRKIEDALTQARDHNAYRKNLEALKDEVEQLQTKVDSILSIINELDPILTAFSLSKDKDIYDQKWIDDVQAAAERRQAMPYLPLSWTDINNAEVFDWQKAIDNGKPNFFIEAETDEDAGGREGRIDMLDNFVATMLLAFPINDVHFTVLENRTVNPFITHLPQKLCDIFDVNKDKESITLFTRKVKEMQRNSRRNEVTDCRPREIVVISGFERKDKIFGKLMEEMHQFIENGHKAGIYFAIVLAKDITQYDWEDVDANDFVEYFEPYSTILTRKKDKQGFPLPNYDLLESDSDIFDVDTNSTKVGTLGDLIVDYATKASQTVPTKVYEHIEDGELYKVKSIADLAKQPRNDVDKLVIPFASTPEGENINLILDDKNYMFYFILGMTGSGKSFTLHTILTNLMLKYDPSILDIVIMDFKGGVEMADYRDVPHVSSILANGADPQVAGEMLLALKQEMSRRSDMFKSCNAKDISEYNAYAIKNGLKQMKHTIFLVDECQELFKIDKPINSAEFIASLAKQGRTYGIHMILATQTLSGAGIPTDALSQFSDFIFMMCEPSDVASCGNTDRALQNQVRSYGKGEMSYWHKGSESVHGYVYNYAGKGGVYKKSTLENLKSKRFARPEKEQFYFDSDQIFHFDDAEVKALTAKAKSGSNPVAMAALGKNMSVNLDTIYSRMAATDGANLLVLGANERMQAERVLWNAVVSSHNGNKAIKQNARYYILPSFASDVDAEALKYQRKRDNMYEDFIENDNVVVADYDERVDMIERVAATVRLRKQLAEGDRNAIKSLDAIYLIIPNQQLLSNRMGRTPKGLDSLDEGLSANAAPKATTSTSDSGASSSDSLGFEGLNMPGSEPAMPAFDAIDFGSFGTSPSPSSSISADKPGRDYDEELHYILENGPIVNVHVMLQTTTPDKIYAGDAMRAKEMTSLFNDIVLLKMQQSESMSLPVDSRYIDRLSTDPKKLRAIAYNNEREPRTIVPFDFK